MAVLSKTPRAVTLAGIEPKTVIRHLLEILAGLRTAIPRCIFLRVFFQPGLYALLPKALERVDWRGPRL